MVFNGRRFIVRARETNISYDRWSDIAHVVSELPTARKPWYIFSPDFVQIATFLASSESARHCLFWIIYHRLFPCLSPCFVEGCLQGKNSAALINVAMNFGCEYFCFVIYFSYSVCDEKVQIVGWALSIVQKVERKVKIKTIYRNNSKAKDQVGN